MISRLIFSRLLNPSLFSNIVVILILLFECSSALADVTSGFEHVSAFGAIGDGRADDTEAFARAVKSASHLYLDKGSYRITKPIRIKKSIVLKMHSGAKIIWDNMTANNSLFDVSSNISVSGGTIVGKWIYTNYFESLESSGNRVRNNFFYIHNSGTMPIDTIDFSGVHYSGCADYCIRIKSYNSGNSIKNFSVVNCNFKKNYAGVQIDNLENESYFDFVLFSHNVFNQTAAPKKRTKEALGGNAINILGGTRDVKVVGNRFENIGRMCLEFITANKWQENRRFRPVNTVIEENYLGKGLYRTFSVVGYSISVKRNTIFTDNTDYIEFRGADISFEDNIIIGGGIYSRGEFYKDNDLRSLKIVNNKFYDLTNQAHVVDTKFYKDVLIQGNDFNLDNAGKASRVAVNAYRCTRIRISQNHFVLKNRFNGISMSIVDCSDGGVINNKFDVISSKDNQIKAFCRFSQLKNFQVSQNKVNVVNRLKLMMPQAQTIGGCTGCSNVSFEENDFSS